MPSKTNPTGEKVRQHRMEIYICRSTLTPMPTRLSPSDPRFADPKSLEQRVPLRPIMAPELLLLLVQRVQSSQIRIEVPLPSNKAALTTDFLSSNRLVQYSGTNHSAFPKNSSGTRVLSARLI